MIRNLLLLGLFALGAACVFLIIQNTSQSVRIEKLNAELATAAFVNQSEVNKVQELAREKAELVDKIAADVAAAERAGERIAVLEYENLALEDTNRKLRDEIADTDPDAAEWMAASMPRALACSMWPGTAACPD